MYACVSFILSQTSSGFKGTCVKCSSWSTTPCRMNSAWRTWSVLLNASKLRMHCRNMLSGSSWVWIFDDKELYEYIMNAWKDVEVLQQTAFLHMSMNGKRARENAFQLSVVAKLVFFFFNLFWLVNTRIIIVRNDKSKTGRKNSTRVKQHH